MDNVNVFKDEKEAREFIEKGRAEAANQTRESVEEWADRVGSGAHKDQSDRQFHFDDNDMPVATPELMEKILRKGRQRAGVPDRYLAARFEHLDSKSDKQTRAYGDVRKYALGFKPRSYPGMVICGTVGTGKTMIACAMVNYLTDKDHNVRFVDLAAMFDRVRDTYSYASYETKSQVIGDFISHDLLVIDEIGIHHGTTDERNILSSVINGRYNKERPTVLVGNLNRQEMIDYMGEHCMDRVLSGGGPLLVFDWESARGGLKR